MARTHSSPVERIGPILLVDDYDDARAAAREALEDAGYRVIEASNGQEALDILVGQPEQRVILVLLDLQMPVMDGWRLLELMHCYVACSTIPVIIVTALEPRLEQVRHPGIFACLRAPYALEDLVKVVDSCLAEARRPLSPTAANT